MNLTLEIFFEKKEVGKKKKSWMAVSFQIVSVSFFLRLTFSVLLDSFSIFLSSLTPSLPKLPHRLGLNEFFTWNHFRENPVSLIEFFFFQNDSEIEQSMDKQ